MTALRDQFLEAMSRAATFVAVLATDGPGGRHGTTVSSLTSVSADGERPSLLACVHHMSGVAPAILKNRAFCANLLAEGQQGVSDIFAGRSGATGAERFNLVPWWHGTEGQPHLSGATARIECRLATALLWETHYIIIGRVQSVTLSEDASALLYGGRAYRRAVGMEGEQT